MFEGLRHLIEGRPLTHVLRDIFDILIVAYVIYRALLVLRGTRAMQMGLGLGIVFLVYLGAKLFDLVTLLNLLSWLLSSIILIVVVVFQNDIRRALIRVGSRAWFSGGREQQSRVIDEVVAAATELARHRMGAIIAFEQDANVLEFVKSDGIILESTVTRELLVSIFVPESVNKLHDGAVLIRDLKIARAGVFFPMPETKILDASLGSRHRAALGITEETDAVIVVVSEERGTISFCFSGNIVSNLDGQSLRHALLGLFGRTARKKSAARKAAGPVSNRPPPIAVTPRTPTAAPTPAPPQSAVTTPIPASTGPKTTQARSSSMPMRSASDPGERSSEPRGPTPIPPSTSAVSPAAPRSTTFVPQASGTAATASPTPIAGAEPAPISEEP